ncbi:MAG: peptide methionine sulfoxide reductase, peptide-methionine (S)-S-oxide reductase [candidate division WS6 bacterium GW2011_GWC1_33_20]|uniref:Peptide methionine sulfoxide reductase MsrA n=1 Tax=candidate division WS6 bacterium GW2011_GWC1_33_20 TaxID=1619089 RepID=A0A0F9ZI20_9BACT|nr:MAG: peptide methionine sulfoxide reductase, peptide-methionine (S)-S-oxide reductase [candidate division WS6 bacterium GW2011_GWC1_33_20]HBB64366.1 peptide-methionine (S)-S-oxide reductase [Patescibacteria group bacterium]
MKLNKLTPKERDVIINKRKEIIVIGGGCFWCIEAVFQRVDGVISAIPGYAGGTSKNPSYMQVCTGNTGHAEVIKVIFDPEKVSLRKILKIFFLSHDPTTLNRQGNDMGTQYRSIVLYSNESQKKVIESVIGDIQRGSEKKIVTEIEALDIFYEAEEYHKNFFNSNPNSSYCKLIIKPKLDKVLQEKNRIKN